MENTSYSKSTLPIIVNFIFVNLSYCPKQDTQQSSQRSGLRVRTNFFPLSCFLIFRKVHATNNQNVLPLITQIIVGCISNFKKANLWIKEMFWTPHSWNWITTRPHYSKLRKHEPHPCFLRRILNINIIQIQEKLFLGSFLENQKYN